MIATNPRSHTPGQYQHRPFRTGRHLAIPMVDSRLKPMRIKKTAEAVLEREQAMVAPDFHYLRGLTAAVVNKIVNPSENMTGGAEK
jgi:hypothetical protein